MIIYINKTLGTDDNQHGFGPGADAFATRQYAWDSIPDIRHETYWISLSNDVYDDPLVMAGKTAGGDYEIVWVGELVLLVSGILQNSTKGDGSNQGSVSCSGAFTGLHQKLLHTHDPVEQWELIDSATDDGAIINGAFYGGAPTGAFEVYDWGTKFAGDVAVVAVNQQQVRLSCIDLEGDSYVYSASYDEQIEYRYCRLTGQVGFEANSKGMARQCLFVGRDSFTYVTSGAFTEFVQCQFVRGENSPHCLRASVGSEVYIDGGCTFDGNNAAPGTIGVYSTEGADVYFDPLHIPTMGAATFRNWAVGAKADQGGNLHYGVGGDVCHYENNTVNSSIPNQAQKSYAPQLLTPGSSIGNGSISGTISVVNGVALVYVSLVIGSSTNLGTGVITISLPSVPFKSQLIGIAMGDHAGTPLQSVAFWNGSTNSFVIRGWTKTAPLTWAAGDYIVAQYQYYIR